MQSLNNFYKEFCVEEFDKDGLLKKFRAKYEPDFNFAYDVVDRIAALDPQRVAIVWCNDKGEERKFTYADIKTYSDKAANLFLQNGVKKGDRVMLILKRHYQFWFAIIGLHKIGAVAIPATNQLMVKDIVYRFDAAEITAVVCTADGDISDKVDEAAAQYGKIAQKLLVRGEKSGWLSFDNELEKASDSLERVKTKADELMLLYFTSGTTGYPKMVGHDYSYPIAHIITAKYWHNIQENDLHLTVSETGWAKSVWGKLYGQWFCCAAVFVFDFDKFVAEDMLAKIAQYKVTTFCAPPTIYRFLIKDSAKTLDLSSLRYAVTAGEALNPEVFNKFYEMTGLKLMEAFGQTETTVMLANIVGMKEKVGSMGKPSPLYDIALVDENGNDVSTGEVGEIVIRANREDKPNGVFMGYISNEELTNKAWHDGLYHTGDTAWIDEDGYYWYVGRTDDIIKSSGYRIGPFEIESVLMEHSAVLECAVTGLPDPVRGQVVKATIVLTKGTEATEELKNELKDFVKKQTAPYKYPRVIEFVSELPKTISGKIKRADIRKG